MEYKCRTFIKGGMGRPSYDGYVNIYSNKEYPDFHNLVFSKLKRTSFPEIWLNDVVVSDIKKIG